MIVMILACLFLLIMCCFWMKKHIEIIKKVKDSNNSDDFFKVTAKIIDYKFLYTDHYHDNEGPWRNIYAPIIEYTYNGTKYRHVMSNMQSYDKRKLGENIEINVDKTDPHNVIETKVSYTSLLLMIPFMLLAIYLIVSTIVEVLTK